MSITPDSVQALLASENYGDRIRGLNELRQLDPQIGLELVQPALTDSNTRVRYAAVSQMDTLGKVNPELALSLLRDRLLNDPEPDVQAAAADALGALRFPDVFPDLQQLYHQTGEWLVKFSIIAALGELSDPRAYDLLVEALAGENDLIQTAAISSLGELGDPRAIDLLTPYVTHADWQIRYRLVQALARLEGPEVQSALGTLSQDEVEQIAQEAKAALGR